MDKDVWFSNPHFQSSKYLTYSIHKAKNPKNIMINKLSRRNFLKNLGMCAVSAQLLTIFQNCYSNMDTLPQKSTIVRVTHPEATDKSGGKDNVNLNESIIREMVDKGIKAFTGKRAIEEAWEKIIPNQTKKVAIKINCQITGIYTKAKIVKALTDGLILRGVPPSNIIIYDLTDHAFSYAGFQKNTGPGIKVGTNAEFGGYSWISWFGIPFLGNGRRFCKVLSGEGMFGCDYLINIPVLKALDGYSGVSLSMKNHFGSIANCGVLHSAIHDSIAALNAHSLIVKKTRLILLDAIFAE
ncbi:MAG: DUF362 domain-containing protein, partial [Thermodesulfobacteriota bacterium]|nr:DUF362 domain-containing protein [Thermodesulfobacteriota bacterium]